MNIAKRFSTRQLKYLLVLLPAVLVVAFSIVPTAQADDGISITDLVPPTPTPDPYAVTPDPTPEVETPTPTPEALPDTGAGDNLVIVLAVLFSFSTAAYFLVPSKRS